MFRAIINRKKEILLGCLICYMINVVFMEDEEPEEIAEEIVQVERTKEPEVEPHPELNVTVNLISYQCRLFSRLKFD